MANKSLKGKLAIIKSKYKNEMILIEDEASNIAAEVEKPIMAVKIRFLQGENKGMTKLINIDFLNVLEDVRDIPFVYKIKSKIFMFFNK